jgi:putative methyltransferase (TIGR04325 family)
MANLRSRARSLITDLTPPIALRSALKVWRHARGLGSHTFEGCYPTLSAVPCGENRYDDEEIAEEMAGSLDRLGTFVANEPTFDNHGRYILPAIVAQHRGQSLTVLDFGGGPCVGLRLIADHVRSLDLSDFTYWLVETPALCRAVKRRIAPVLLARFGSASFVTVAEDIPAAIPRPLLVSASSAIQYMSDYRGTIVRLAALSPFCFIVSLTPFTDGPTYARQQLNIPQKRLATWVFNRSEFISEMEQLGYFLSFTVDHELPVTYGNAPGSSSFASMVFRPRVPAK